MIPIVLHHGLLGFTNLRIGKLRLSYFRNIDRALIERGHPLVVTQVHPTGSVALRARQLKAIILRNLRQMNLHHQRILIIAHSMGGLDARYMITRLGMHEYVAALLTICTPHRGTTYADWCLLNLGQRLGGLHLMNLLGLDMPAISDLTTTNCARFNAEVPDMPDVKYFSIGAARPWNKVPPFALHAHRVITSAEGPNDCLVSVKSSMWGEHLDVWPADHFHTINHRLIPELRDPTGDITPYYLQALDNVLARLNSAGR